jgi:hypothetical protein
VNFLFRFNELIVSRSLVAFWQIAPVGDIVVVM